MTLPASLELRTLLDNPRAFLQQILSGYFDREAVISCLTAIGDHLRYLDETETQTASDLRNAEEDIKDLKQEIEDFEIDKAELAKELEFMAVCVEWRDVRLTSTEDQVKEMRAKEREKYGVRWWREHIASSSEDSE